MLGGTAWRERLGAVTEFGLSLDDAELAPLPSCNASSGDVATASTAKDMHIDVQ